MLAGFRQKAEGNRPLEILSVDGDTIIVHNRMGWHGLVSCC
jgi:hypothetical protein